MPEQGLPINPIQKRCNEIFAATPAIWDLLTDDGDKVFDQLVPPTENNEVVRPMPYLAWGNVTDTPHGDFSSAFGQAGSSSTLQLHVFDGHKFTKSFAVEIIDKIKRALSGKKHTLDGFQTLTFLVNTQGVFEVPTGQQGMMMITCTTRTNPTP
jgi:hypothetical protein